MNSPAVLRWSMDKRYLAALSAAGVPIVPTVWLEAPVAGGGGVAQGGGGGIGRPGGGTSTATDLPEGDFPKGNS